VKTFSSLNFSLFQLKSQPLEAAGNVVSKNSNKFHMLFSHRIKGMFKKSKKLQTTKSKEKLGVD